MKKFIEWTDTKAGKKIRLRYCGKKEDIERTALNISRVWNSPETNIVIVEKGAERTALSIIRK